ncbi:glucokinase [Hydrogenophaga sp. BPS33]|uniref:glucokinase n=1 Tax=Hydrogenophaga sp. BPS33 TaxID=2651974 RepID=UPI00131FC7A1|nr:glucokinase [Hydrogenophaga sp. BPS33]QHE84232.1 glucokinase [Hydrogenophaga sp. BPS33]
MPSTLNTGRLLADVGGTNARMAWQDRPGAPIEHIEVLPVAEHANLREAIGVYLNRLDRRPTEAAIAIANPVTGDRVSMTNHDWSFSQAALREALGLSHLRVLNDFTALALAVPHLASDDLRQIGGGAAVTGAAIGVVGAGTGLGVSGLLSDGSGAWRPIAGEGGHVTLPAETARERLVMDALTRRYGHASAERVASGPGLLETCAILCEADGVAADAFVNAASVSHAALQDGHPQAMEALRMFCAVLGSVAGNLALTLGSQGGVYIGGGVVPRLGAWFDDSPFRERFEAKGRFSGYLSSIPVWVITARQSPALLGAALALDAHA